MGTKLTRSSRDKKIMGVCGGIAEYLHIDSTLLRIIWAIAVCCFGSGLLLYIIAGIIMPQDFGQRSNTWNGQNGYNGYNEYSNNSYSNGYNNNNSYNNGYNNYNNYNNGNSYSSNNANYESRNSSNVSTGSYYNGNRNNSYYSSNTSNSYELYSDRK